MDMKDTSPRPMKHADMLDQHLLVNTKPPSIDDLQSEDLVSSVDELVIKVRKPYTITKQRERWTEEEHEKFLEALKLYGRAWCQIQEYIGTKTAVQIRSHAQKFFSKVVREPGTEKAIEIPPPRPKRKPLHPYPRKFSHAYPKRGPVLEKQEQSSLPVPSFSEQDSGSPVSVLSAAGSDTLESLACDRPNSCTSTLSVAFGSDQVEPPLGKQETRCCSSTSSGVEEDQSSSPGLAPFAVVEQEAIPMELDSVSQDEISHKEASPSEGQSTSLKLFGRTVLVPDSQKSCSSSVGNPECTTGGDISSHMNVSKTGLSTATVPFTKFLGHEDSCGLPNRSMWDRWHGGLPTMYYYMTPNYNSASPMTAFAPLPPWWAFCSNSSFPFIDQINESSKQDLPQGFKEALDETAKKEGSSTGSSPVTERRGAVDNDVPKMIDDEGFELLKEPAFNFKLTPSENSAFTRVTVSNTKSTRGFAPYKRCVDGNQTQQYANNDKDGQVVGLCL